MDRLTLAPHDACREVDFETAQPYPWFLASGIGAAQICQQAGYELARPERLRHVVIRAGFERTHLLFLLAHRRQQDHRHRAPLA